jgi:hypothetical protein
MPRPRLRPRKGARVQTRARIVTGVVVAAKPPARTVAAMPSGRREGTSPAGATDLGATATAIAVAIGAAIVAASSR